LKLGTAQLRSREFAAAEKSYTDCLRLQPQDAEALNGLGMARAQRGRANEAAQCFQAALKAKPDYAPAMLNLAIVAQNSLRDRRLGLGTIPRLSGHKASLERGCNPGRHSPIGAGTRPPRPQTNAVVPSPAPEVAGIPVATNTTTQAGRLALTPTTHTSSPPVISRTLTSPKSEPPPTTKSGTPATKPPPAKPVASNVVVKNVHPPPAATAATPVVQERIETTQLTRSQFLSRPRMNRILSRSSMNRGPRPWSLPPPSPPN
jgi:hypothetical protein